MKPNWMMNLSLSTIGAFLFGLMLLAATPVSLAQDAIDEDAQKVLQGMSAYIGGLEAFSTQTEIDFEVVDIEGQKLQFISSGALSVQRPGRLHLTRKGAVMDAELFLSGNQMTIHGKNLNAYVQIGDQSSIEYAIETLRATLDFGAPGADFIYASPADRLLTETTSGYHVGMTTIDGQSVHHLAFRNQTVDWQIWVADSDQPVPLKYIITNKWVMGAPQYTIRFRNWNVTPTLENSLFQFVPPNGAKKLDVFLTNEIGELVISGE